MPLTARYAQHWNFAGGPPELFAQKRDVLAARCADIGRDPKQIVYISPPHDPAALEPLAETIRDSGLWGK